MRASVYIAISLDGFIARTNGDLDWLPGSGDGAEDSEASGGDLGYGDFLASVDVLVMGRHSFEKVLSFGPWPYEDKRVVVHSRKPVDIPPDISTTVEWKSSAPHALVAQLVKDGAQHLYVDGGKTIQGFLRAGLIQHLIITTIPVLIGDGIPLFGRLESDVMLRHLATTALPNGFVQSRYEVGG